MVDIRPNALPDAILPLRSGDAIIVDQGADGVRQTDPISMTDSVAPVATQAEAQAGTDNTKRMTPLRTKQSIASEVGVSLASSSQGSKADSAVQSVNGKTGNSVTITKSDVGLGNVDNTSDANKPVSTAQQSALDLKANASVTISAGTGLTGGGTLAANRTVSLNPASIASLAKADTSVQTVNGVPPTSGNVNVDGGIPDNNSVTDPKLPSYSDSLSPSSAKLRYQASTSAGALAGAIQRPVDLKLSDLLHASDFGVKADGTADDTAAMVAAISAMETTGRPLFLPPGVIMANPDALKFGDGGGHGVSTRHGHAMFGCGVDTAFNGQGTIIRARQAGGLLFETRAVSGARISGLTFDCAGLCNNGLKIISSIGCSFVDFCVRDFLFAGLELTCYDGPANAPMWTSNNRFENFYIVSTQNVEWSAGLVMTGIIGKNFDPHRNTFIGGVVQLPRVAGPGGAHGAYFKFCDSNTFIECDIGVYGSGNGAGVLFSSTDNAGFPYPQNQFMYGCSLSGGVSVYEPNSTSIGPNFFVCHTTRDGEGLPNHPQIKGFSDDGFWFSDPEVVKDAAAVVLQSRSGSYRYRVMANVTDADDFGFAIQQWISGDTWQTLASFKVGDNPKLFFPSLGLREVQAGDVDTGGSGFRLLVVAN